MATFAHRGLIIVIISNIIVASSSDCKSVLLENCSERFCIANITIVSKCPTNSAEDETKKNCENFTDLDLPNDTFLFRPVTNEPGNVTYWNMYCALCNGEDLGANRLKFWTLRAYHRGNISSKSAPFVSDINSAMMEKIQLDNNTKQLFSNINGITRNILPLRYLPLDLKNSSCELCPFGADERVEFLRENDIELSSVSEDLNCTGKKCCPNGNSKIPQPGTCVYFDKDGISCSKNKFLVEKIDFVYNGSKIILSDGSVFDSYTYSDVGERVVFLCFSQDDRHPITRIMHKCFDYIEYVSAFLLFLFLVMKANRNNFKGTLDVILYSYCVASFAVYLFNIFGFLLDGRMIFRTYLLLYIYLCHAFWAAIISYEYWFIVWKSVKRERTEIKFGKYRIYGVIGWALPASLLLAVFPFLTEEDKSAVCPWLANYRSRAALEYLSEWARILLSFLLLLYVAIFVVLISLLGVQSYYFIRLALRKKRSHKRQSVEQKRNKEPDYVLIFTKVAYLMGIHWMLICIAVLFSFVFHDFANVVGNIGSFLFAGHGTFLFFAYGFKSVLAWCKCVYKSCERPNVSASNRVSRIETDDAGMSPSPDAGK